MEKLRSLHTASRDHVETPVLPTEVVGVMLEMCDALDGRRFIRNGGREKRCSSNTRNFGSSDFEKVSEEITRRLRQEPSRRVREDEQLTSFCFGRMFTCLPFFVDFGLGLLGGFLGFKGVGFDGSASAVFGAFDGVSIVLPLGGGGKPGDYFLTRGSQTAGLEIAESWQKPM